MFMINETRLLDNFLKLVKIKAPSFEEKPVANFLKDLLTSWGFDVLIDESKDQTGSNTGNVIARLSPSCGFEDWIAFSAHMDTVYVNREVIPCVKDEVVTSDGETILGADDRAGIAAILEAVAVILERNIPHPGLELIFTVAEEKGLLGAKALDWQAIRANRVFVLDNSMSPGRIIVAAPTQYKLLWTVHGKASHAGVAPEKGVSAILAAASGIIKVPQGRIDEETTANIGIINGGKATNIVCDRVDIQAEARSLDERKVEELVEAMSQSMRAGVEAKGAWLEEQRKLSYPGYRINKNNPVVVSAINAILRSGLEPKLVSAGGGSDGNIFNAAGLTSVNLAIGMKKVHTAEEQIAVKDLVKTAEIVYRLMAGM